MDTWIIYENQSFLLVDSPLKNAACVKFHGLNFTCSGWWWTNFQICMAINWFKNCCAKSKTSIKNSNVALKGYENLISFNIMQHWLLR